MRKFFLILALSGISFPSLACNPKSDIDAAVCIAGLGVVGTASIAILDYGYSKAAAHDRAIPSDKQAEFIVGIPVAFATLVYFYSKLSNSKLSNLATPKQEAYAFSPYVSEGNAIGVAFHKGF
ncbi:MAG: hypothetical protein Q7U16_12020 [Agitococcus sp.]|nr:hypothetical protein [Agitococcus sp.]